MKAAATSVVLDASTALSWFHPDEEVTPESEAALAFVAEHGALVPGNFFSEITNALLRAQRRKQFDATATTSILADLLALDLRVEIPDPHVVVTVARERGLTGYDGSYLALAVERRCALITIDRNLRNAAGSMNLLWSAVE